MLFVISTCLFTSYLANSTLPYKCTRVSSFIYLFNKCLGFDRVPSHMLGIERTKAKEMSLFYWHLIV